MTKLNRFALVLCALALSACSSNPLKGTFENRLACSLDGREGYFVSKYGWLGISAEVAAADAAHMCVAASAAAASAGPAASRAAGR